jgi:hypothetical protein
MHILWFELKDPLQVHVLKAWSLAELDVLGGCKKFRMGLDGGADQWDPACLGKSYLNPRDRDRGLYFTSAMRSIASFSHCPWCHYVWPHHQPRMNEAKDYGLKSLKHRSKIIPPSFNLFISESLTQ